MEKFLFKDKNDLLFYIIGISSIFGFLENIIPKPLIFIKLGFSNIPFLLILDLINLKELFIILFLKSLISAFFSGSIFTPTFLLSLSGVIGIFFGFSILLIFSKILNYFQIFIKKNKNKNENKNIIIKITDIFSLITISIFLAFFSNLFQLFFYSFFLVKDITAFSILFILTLLSILSGFFTGFISFKLKKIVNFIY